MDRAKIDRIRNAVAVALKSAEAELGVTLKLGPRCTFDPNGFAKFSLEASEQVNGEVYTAEMADFRRACARYGLLESDLHREFDLGGVTYKVMGVKIKNRKYPIVGDRVSDGARFKFTSWQVKQALEGQPV